MFCPYSPCGVDAAYLVFVRELLHRTKQQQAHVDQLLQVHMERKDVSPEVENTQMLHLESTTINRQEGGGAEVGWGGARGRHRL